MGEVGREDVIGICYSMLIQISFAYVTNTLSAACLCKSVGIPEQSTKNLALTSQMLVQYHLKSSRDRGMKRDDKER